MATIRSIAIAALIYQPTHFMPTLDLSPLCGWYLFLVRALTSPS